MENLIIDVKIKFYSPDDVIHFVKVTSTFSCDFDLYTGKILIDGKSLLGILSLDISKPIGMKVYTRDHRQKENVIKSLGQYFYEEGR